MLKGIPSILTPELLKTLMEMGHSDEIVIADGNFPSGTFGKKVIRLDGHGVPEVLDAILKFFPLDPYVEKPAETYCFNNSQDFSIAVSDFSFFHVSGPR